MRRAAVAALLVAGSITMPVSSAAADDGTVFSFTDQRITESSGLLDLGPRMVTANDSGNPSQLFVVDPVSGNTVGVTEFHAETVDVEALAPAGGARVWVGDIGDNTRTRTSLSLYRVEVGVGETDEHPGAYRLVYPDGPHDAESLFSDRQGRLHVITKSFEGGTVYRAPRRLSSTGPNRLVRVGSVLELATDAAMLPDGRHVLVRGLGLAGVYTVPRFRRLGGFQLPQQRQGEGVSVGPGGRIRLSSEGVGSAVRQVSIPARLARVMRRRAPLSSSTSSPASVRASGSGGRAVFGWRSAPTWVKGSIAGIGALCAIAVGAGRRRRSRRS